MEQSGRPRLLREGRHRAAEGAEILRGLTTVHPMRQDSILLDAPCRLGTSVDELREGSWMPWMCQSWVTATTREGPWAKASSTTGLLRSSRPSRVPDMRSKTPTMEVVACKPGQAGGGRAEAHGQRSVTSGRLLSGPVLTTAIIGLSGWKTIALTPQERFRSEGAICRWVGGQI